LELGLLFGLAPGVLSLGPRWAVLPGIMAGGGLCLAILLRDPTFPRGRLLQLAPPWQRPGLRRVLVRAALVWTGLLAVTLLSCGPDGLFDLPRTRPGIWLAIALLYPVLSVYPQEIMFRAFFFHRYADLLGRPAVRIAVNAALFGWAHVIVHNNMAVLLATAGGILFASTYERSRSLLLVTVEHALYGVFVFTVGLGGMFVSGVRLLTSVIR
jgi:membrane protease YdiL (CAAX protease family)